MLAVDLARESAFSFPKIPICPGTHEKEIEKNSGFSIEMEQRIFKTIVEHLEWKGFPVEILAWESKDIRGQAKK